MDEKANERRPRIGILFWSSLVALALIGGFVAGWQSSNGWLRTEREDLKEQVERYKRQLSGIKSEIERAKRRRDALTK